MNDRQNRNWWSDDINRPDLERDSKESDAVMEDFKESGFGELDLSAIQADDALLDALGSDLAHSDDFEDQELSALLLAWRRDIDSEPFPELVDTDTATEVLRTTNLQHYRAKKARKRRLIAPVAAAAVVLGIVFTGSGLAARDAQPGDTLWVLTKVLYAEHARSIEAAASVRDDLKVADTALNLGRLEQARKALDEAGAALRQVAGSDDLAHLSQQHDLLSQKLQNPSTPQTPDPSVGTSTPSGGATGSDSGSSTKPSDPTDSVTPTSPSSPPSTSPSETGSPTSPSSPPGSSSGGTTPRDDTSASVPASQP